MLRKPASERWWLQRDPLALGTPVSSTIPLSTGSSTALPGNSTAVPSVIGPAHQERFSVAPGPRSATEGAGPRFPDR